MKLLRLVILSVSLLVATPQPATAGSVHHLSGGGTASISQVAMNVVFSASDSASGSFECLMAGRSKGVLVPFGLSHIMAVHATPNAGTVNGSVASFSGSGQLIMDGGQPMPIHVVVSVDVSTQTFQLTVVDLVTLPPEHMLTGHLSLD